MFFKELIAFLPSLFLIVKDQQNALYWKQIFCDWFTKTGGLF